VHVQRLEDVAIIYSSHFKRNYKVQCMHYYTAEPVGQAQHVCVYTSLKRNELFNECSDPKRVLVVQQMPWLLR